MYFIKLVITGIDVARILYTYSHASTNRLRDLGYSADVMSVHGFRSTASTILHEQGWNHDIIEAQLAHLTGTATSRAYNRSIYLADRKKMMQAWADYLDYLIDS